MRNRSYWAAASALAAGLMLSVPAAAVPIVLTGNHVKVGISDSGTFGGVPKHATWAMTIAGFGMVGGAMRSTRHKVKAVTA